MGRRFGFAAAALLAGLGAGQGIAAAQGIQPNPEREPAREVESQRDERRAAETAAGRGGLGATVPYEALLADPDNIDLNLRYVEQRIEAGELRAAVSALERVLALQPENARARLLYGLVLFRLDNLAEAERELLAVRPLPMADDLRAQIDDYLRQIDLRRRDTRYFASLSLGAHYDTNRDAAPSSRRRRALGVDTDAQRGVDDFGILGIGTFEVRHDLGSQAKHDLFARATLFWDEQFRLPQQDVQAVFLEAGATWRGELVTAIPSVTFTGLRLNREDYLQAAGFRLRLERRLDATFQVFAEGHLQHQDFDRVSRTGRKNGTDIGTAPTAHTQSGRRLDSEAGVVITFSPEHQLTLAAGLTSKDAHAEYQAYDGGRLQASHLWLLGEGQFLLGSLSAERYAYDQPDPLVDSEAPRREWLYRARLTYGTPLQTLFGQGLPEGVGDLLWTGTVELYRADANLPNYSYENLRFQTLLTKRWEF